MRRISIAPTVNWLLLVCIACGMSTSGLRAQVDRSYQVILTVSNGDVPITFEPKQLLQSPIQNIRDLQQVSSRDGQYRFFINDFNVSEIPLRYAFDLYIRLPSSPAGMADHWRITEDAANVAKDHKSDVGVSLLFVDSQDPTPSVSLGKVPIYSALSVYKGMEFQKTDAPGATDSSVKLHFKNVLPDFPVRIRDAYLVTKCFDCWEWSDPKAKETQRVSDCGDCWRISEISEEPTDVPIGSAYEIELDRHPKILRLLTSSFIKNGAFEEVELRGTAVPRGGLPHTIRIVVPVDERPALVWLVLPVLIGALIGFGLSKISPDATPAPLDPRVPLGSPPLGAATTRATIKQIIWVVAIAMLVEAICVATFTSPETRVSILGWKLDPSQIPQAFFLAIFVGGGSSVSSGVQKAYKVFGK